MWKSIAGGSIGQYRQTDQYLNGPFIIQLMHGSLHARWDSKEHKNSTTQHQ